MRLVAIALSVTCGLGCGGEARSESAEAPSPPSSAPRVDPPEDPPPPPPRWAFEAVDRAEVRGPMRLLSRSERVVLLYAGELTSHVASRATSGWSARELEHVPAAGALDAQGRVWALGDFGLEPAVLRVGLLSRAAHDAPARVSPYDHAWSSMDMVIDDAGVVHVCFHEQETNGDGSGSPGPLRYARGRDDAWSNVVVTDLGYEGCVLAVDREDVVHLATPATDSAGFSRMHYFRGGATGFREVRAVRGYLPARIAVDAQGRVHLGYRAFLGGQGNVMSLGHVMLDGDAAEPHAATDVTLARSFDGGEQVAFVFEPSGRLHAAFRHADMRLGYATFDDGGWQHEIVSAETEGLVRPWLAIALDEGRPIIAFPRGRDEVMMARLAPPP